MSGFIVYWDYSMFPPSDESATPLAAAEIACADLQGCGNATFIVVYDVAGERRVAFDMETSPTTVFRSEHSPSPRPEDQPVSSMFGDVYIVTWRHELDAKDAVDAAEQAWAELICQAESRAISFAVQHVSELQRHTITLPTELT